MTHATLPVRVLVLSADLVRVRQSDGVSDSYHLCERHGWSSRGETSDTLALRTLCIECEAERDSAEGHRHYAIVRQLMDAAAKEGR